MWKTAASAGRPFGWTCRPHRPGHPPERAVVDGVAGRPNNAGIPVSLERIVMNAATEMSPFIFSDSAANKVKALIEEEGNPDLKLRVFVTGGGCSGFQYGFTFDEVTNEDDMVMQKNGVTLLIDPMSMQYMMGAEIDYTEGLEGAQFVIRNPNAVSTCGCGSSFSV
jgi:iron-sulfur cluster insertion protein